MGIFAQYFRLVKIINYFLKKYFETCHTFQDMFYALEEYLNKES